MVTAAKNRGGPVPHQPDLDRLEEIADEIEKGVRGREVDAGIFEAFGHQVDRASWNYAVDAEAPPAHRWRIIPHLSGDLSACADFCDRLVPHATVDMARHGRSGPDACQIAIYNANAMGESRCGDEVGARLSAGLRAFVMLGRGAEGGDTLAEAAQP